MFFETMFFMWWCSWEFLGVLVSRWVGNELQANGNTGRASEWGPYQGKALLLHVAKLVRDRYEVCAHQAHRPRGLRHCLFIHQQRDQGEGCNKEDKQCVWESRGRTENPSWDKAPKAPPAWKRDFSERHHDAYPEDEFQGCLSCVWAHGHWSSSDHQVFSGTH